MSANSPRVSTIIPVFNGARYLAEAIASVLMQSCAVTEVIVVDDGSTDDSAAIAVAAGERIRVIRQANRGQAEALNAGLNQVTGDYICFLDADDLWEPDKVARQLNRFDARPELGYCVTRIRNFVTPELADRRQSLDPALFDDAPGYTFPALMARRRVFDEVGPLDATWVHANKTAWFLRARELGVVGEAIGDVLVHRRLHTSNISQRRASHSVDEYLRLVKASLDRGRRVPTA